MDLSAPALKHSTRFRLVFRKKHGAHFDAKLPLELGLRPIIPYPTPALSKRQRVEWGTVPFGVGVRRDALLTGTNRRQVHAKARSVDRR